MLVTMPRQALADTLKAVSRASTDKGILPGLACVAIEADDKYLTFRATDTQLGIRLIVEQPAERPGTVALPAKTLTDLVAKLPDGDVRLAVEGSRALLQAGPSSYGLPSMPADEVPTMASPLVGAGAVMIGSKDLTAAIRRVVYAVDDTVQGAVKGVRLWGLSDRLDLVGTDGHRMAVASACVDMQSSASLAPDPPASPQSLALIPTGDGAGVGPAAFNAGWINAHTGLDSGHEMALADDVEIRLADGSITALHKAPRSTYISRYSGSKFGEQKLSFVSYQEMRLTYLKSEPVRAIVDTVSEEASGARWDIVPDDPDNPQLKQAARDMAKRWAKRKGLHPKRDRKRIIAYAKRQFAKLEKDQRERMEILRKLFQRPNQQDNFHQFFRKVIKDVLVLDAGAIEKERDRQGRLCALWPVDGATITVEADDHGVVQRYWQGEYTTAYIEFPLTDLIYLMQHPGSDTVYGTSPLETLYLSVATDLYVHKWLSDYFEKDGIPPGILAVLGITSDVEMKRFEARIKRWRAENPYNVPIVQAEKVQYTPVSAQTNRETQLMEYLDKLLNRICMVYRVNPSELGITQGMGGGIGSTVADRQAEITESKAIGPLLDLFAGYMTDDVIHREFGWRDLKFAFVQDNSAAEDREREQDLQDLEAGLTTPNRILEKRGEKPVPWGDLPTKQLPYWQPEGMGPEGPGMPGMPPGGPGGPGGPEQPPVPGMPALPANKPDQLEQMIQANQAQQKQKPPALKQAATNPWGNVRASLESHSPGFNQRSQTEQFRELRQAVDAIDKGHDDLRKQAGLEDA